MKPANTLTPMPAGEATHTDLQKFLAEAQGKTMLEAHGLRRAFRITPQRVNENLPGYAIDIHEKKLAGIGKPIGSLRVSHGELIVMHHLPNAGQTEALNQLSHALSRKFHWQLKILPNI